MDAIIMETNVYKLIKIIVLGKKYKITSFFAVRIKTISAISMTESVKFVISRLALVSIKLILLD